MKIKTDVAKNTKRGQNSDYENDGDGALGTRHSKKQSHHMRIASSGKNPSDKDHPSRSDHNELASIEDRSFDPDHEPRKEGSMKMKHSPSVAEILPNIDGLSEGGSIGGMNDKSLKRGSHSRSPGRVKAHVTDNEEDVDYGTLNRDNK